MTKSAKQIQQELREYLAGKTDKELNLSDSRIIAADARGRRVKQDGTMKRAAKRRSENPQWQASRKDTFERRSQNADWLEKKTQASRQLAQDPVWLANQKVGAAKRKARPDYEEKRKQAAAKAETNQEFVQARAERNRANAQDPNWKKQQQAGVIARNQDPEYQQKLLASARQKLINKGFIVSPAGVHLRQSESADANNINITSLQRRIKNDPVNYYYISHEEYIMLFGKEYDGD